jgi:hypothetical protein
MRYSRSARDETLKAAPPTFLHIFSATAMSEINKKETLLPAAP